VACALGADIGVDVDSSENPACDDDTSAVDFATAEVAACAAPPCNPPAGAFVGIFAGIAADDVDIVGATTMIIELGGKIVETGAVAPGFLTVAVTVIGAAACPATTTTEVDVTLGKMSGFLTASNEPVDAIAAAVNSNILVMIKV